MNTKEQVLVEATAEALRCFAAAERVGAAVLGLRTALKAYSAYPEFCMQPELCAGKGYCPREIACDD